MDIQEYEYLQKLLSKKIIEGKKKYLYSTARADGWEQAILCIKSILSTQFKPDE